MTERRVTITLKNPNPLFKKWLKECLDYAEQKGMRERAYTLNRALNALDKYPLPLKFGRDCVILDGFGKGLCAMLDMKLEKYRKNSAGISRAPSQSQPGPELPKPVDAPKLGKTGSFDSKSRRDDPSEVIPAKRLRKSKSAEELRPDAGPAKSPAKSKRKTPQETVTTADFVMMPGTFEIILLVDAQETIGKNKRYMDATLVELEKNRVKFEVRHLNVGDFVWIARDNRSRELVLPYIVERKRLDDFAHSIKDGRFHEQKFRLRTSGIPHVIYLIEYIALQNYGLPVQSLSQAAINAEVHNDCQVKFTDSGQDTVLYLVVQTELLAELFATKTLHSCAKQSIGGEVGTVNVAADTVRLMHFSEFNASASKWGAVNVKDYFVRQLIQLYSVSVEKALAITDQYPTPRRLLMAYAALSQQKDRENMLAKIPYGGAPGAAGKRRTIGPSLSKTVYDFYHADVPG